MTEEPENMLEQHRITTTSSIKETGTKVGIGQQHGNNASQNGHNGNQQVCCYKESPYEQWHLHISHTRSTHIHNSNNDINRAHY